MLPQLIAGAALGRYGPRAILSASKSTALVGPYLAAARRRMLSTMVDAVGALRARGFIEPKEAKGLHRKLMALKAKADDGLSPADRETLGSVTATLAVHGYTFGEDMLVSGVDTATEAITSGVGHAKKAFAGFLEDIAKRLH